MTFDEAIGLSTVHIEQWLYKAQSTGCIRIQVCVGPSTDTGAELTYLVRDSDGLILWELGAGHNYICVSGYWVNNEVSRLIRLDMDRKIAECQEVLSALSVLRGEDGGE
jgi:hypothetical protein